MEADGESGEDRRGVRAAIAAQRFVHMFKAALDRDPMARKKRQLRGPVRQAFQGSETVDRRDLTDGVHLGVNVQRGKAGRTLVEIGNALAELRTNVAERYGWAPACHERSFNDDG